MGRMTDKKPFEEFLKGHDFKEKASGNLFAKLDAAGAWNRPWWRSSTIVTGLGASLILAVILLGFFGIESDTPQTEQMLPEETIQVPTPTLPARLDDIVEGLYGNKKVLDLLMGESSKPSFNLVFIDRPVNFITAIRENKELM